ncbi:MAG: hypothetical protein WC915_03580 [archaeon]
MDNKGKVNHILKIIGIILILLAMTVFAHSEEYRFDCTSRFDCSIKSYCQDIPGAVPGLLVGSGTAYNYTTGALPVEYAFTSTQPGENICSLRVQTTAMHDQGQVNEKTAIYVNGTYLATTADNYCNAANGGGCTFCGTDSQNLGQFTLNLETNNTLRVHGYDSHAIVGVFLDCVPGPNSCYNNQDPQVLNITNKTIKYNSQTEIDLWDYVRDGDDRLSDLLINVTTNNNIVNCTLDNNRYLTCTSSLNLGTTRVTIEVNDKCDVTQKTFDINVINNPPIISVPNYEKSCVQDLNKLVDLRNYSSDEDLALASFNLLSQTNTGLMNCSLDQNYFISCSVNTCDEDYTTLRVEITDIFGLTDTDDFNITLKNYAPEWINIQSTCINISQEVLDLADYVTDVEDGTNLDFEIVSQTNYDNIDCEIVNDSVVDCVVKTNNQTSTTLRVRATDSKGLNVDTEFIVKTNCGDSNKQIITSNTKGVCLENCTSYTENFTTTNNSNETKCYAFDLEYENALNVNITNDSFCLNKGESTTSYLNVITCGSDSDYYDILVIDRDQNVKINFEYTIGSCNAFDGFRIDEFDGKICQGEERTFSVDVSNTTDTDKTINLLAENQSILPYFVKNKVFVENDSTKNVDLVINAKHAPIGKYNILLGGDATNYHIEKRLVLEVQDCSDIQNRNFIISAPEICYDVSKGQIFEGSFNVKRVHEGCTGCSFDEQQVAVALFGMPNELSKYMLSLRKGEENKVYYTIQVPTDAKAGANFLTIKGTEQKDAPFDDEVGFVDDERICLNVLGTSNSSIHVRTSAQDIFWCDSEIFEVEISNDGDFDETFNLSALQMPKGVSVSFSQNTIVVPKNGSKIVYVSVSTSPESEILDSQSILIKLDGNIDLEARLYFNIKEKVGFEDIEILSNTDKIILNKNVEGKYSLQIRNNSEITFKNINLKFENVPVGMNVETKIINEIAPGQIITIEGKITSEVTGDYNLVFVLSKNITNIVLNKKGFNVKVNDNAALAGASGFFGLLGSNIAGLFGLGSLIAIDGISVLKIILVGFLIIFIAIVILGLLLFQNNVHYEHWVEAKK